MSRIIKFRALKDDLPCYFVYGHLIRNAEGAPRIQEDSAKSLFTTCLPGTEGQFTGLYDKSGKEIWEGDVVAISGMYDPETGQTGTDLCEVKYEGPSLMYVRVDGGDKNSVESLIGVRSQDEDAEVIGNIHENPELLKP